MYYLYTIIFWLSISGYCNYIKDKFDIYITKYNEGNKDYVKDLHIQKDNNVEELVDIVQVIYSLLDVRKFSMEKFENMRQQKNINNGAFKERLFLIEAD